MVIGGLKKSKVRLGLGGGLGTGADFCDLQAEWGLKWRHCVHISLKKSLAEKEMRNINT